jgi:triosephosphate isomerase (TIM)
VINENDLSGGKDCVMKFRKRIIAGNWKMNKTVPEAVELAMAIRGELSGSSDVDIVLCPPFTALAAVAESLDGSSISYGAQNMHWENSGAFTGEISPHMLRGLYCHYVILGHSERRTYFGENDEIVNRKAKAALAATLRPIICVGETIEQRQAGDHIRVVENQVRGSLAGIAAADIKKAVVAYEPVWAIGTGLTASPEQAQEMHACIRKELAAMFSQDVAESIRIQYGGSMKPSNAAELLAQPDIDGGLIGGASLEVRSFVELVKIAKERN